MIKKIRLFSIIGIMFHDIFAHASYNFEERSYGIPIKLKDGSTQQLQTRVCTPLSVTSANVVILNHGSPPSSNDRTSVTAYQCDSEVVQWFVTRGYIVASPVRRGYGVTGGVFAEGYGKCEKADFFLAGLETARDIEAVVNFVDQLPHAKNDNVVIVGQSAGGWGAIAFNSLSHPNVKAIINMAGGRGGHYGPQENQNCAPDKLAIAAGQYGVTSTTPMLWIYAKNDSFFSPLIANSLYDAYTKAGGKATFLQKPPFGKDGHFEFAAPGGSKVWGQDVQNYLNQSLSSRP